MNICFYKDLFLVVALCFILNYSQGLFFFLRAYDIMHVEALLVMIILNDSLELNNKK